MKHILDLLDKEASKLKPIPKHVHEAEFKRLVEVANRKKVKKEIPEPKRNGKPRRLRHGKLSQEEHELRLNTLINHNFNFQDAASSIRMHLTTLQTWYKYHGKELLKNKSK